MIIRKFKSSDSAQVAKLHRNTIRNINSRDYSAKQIKVWSTRTSAKRFRQSMSKKRRFIGIDKDKILGFGDFSLNGVLTGLYVHKNFQSKGIGRLLLMKMEQQAKKDNIKEFNLSSTITAKNFYEKNKYKTIKKGYHEINGQKLIIYRMRKKL